MTLLTRLVLSGVLAIGLATPLHAMGTEPAAEGAGATPECKEADKSKCPAESTTAPAKPADSTPAEAAPACKEADKSKCPGKQSFNERYRAAVVLIESERFGEALAAMRELDDGSSADVVNYIGYINRKLGKMAEAQMYYEAALHMVPDHRGALEYYGEWYCMMGNLSKARENLERIAHVHGTGNKEYAALAKMIDETVAKSKS